MAAPSTELGAVMNDIPKVVFSSTLTSADWAESRIAGGDLTEDIDGHPANS